MDPRNLVQQLGTDQPPLDAMRELVGGVTATELRDVKITEPVFEAIVRGLRDPNAKIRWWCVQLLDHVDDLRAIDALIDALDDSVPRVRRNAAHALGCLACKPSWDGSLPDRAIERLATMAERDPNEKVRAQAKASLRCSTTGRGHTLPLQSS